VSELERALEHVRFTAEQGDVRGTERTYRDAVKTAQAATGAARGAAAAELAALAWQLCDALESPEPIAWGLEGAAALGEPLARAAAAELAALDRRFRGLAPAGLAVYAEALERAAAAAEAAARKAKGAARQAARVRADTLREGIWVAWSGLGEHHPSVPLNRWVPAAYVETARSVVKRARAQSASPLDTASLRGSGQPDDDVLYPLLYPDPRRTAEWKPCSLQAAVVLSALADELAEDGDAEGARWAATFAALVPAAERTPHPMADERAEEMVPRLVATARKHGAHGLGPYLRQMLQNHGVEELSAADEAELARLERELP